MKHVKYHVGRFSISDNKASFSAVGVVEKLENRVVSTFWLYLDSLHKEGTISMAFNPVEIRAFAYALKAKFKDKDFEHSTQTGGTATVKNLNIFNSANGVYVGATHKNLNLSVGLSKFELLGLASELEHLVQTTVDATYKTQQVLDRKKAKSVDKHLKKGEQ